MTDPIEIMALAQCARFNWKWDKMSESRRALSRNEMHDIISALDAAGWAIVPKVPTEEMIGAARSYCWGGECEWRDVFAEAVEAGRVKP